jgi:hypothetical protein
MLFSPTAELVQSYKEIEEAFKSFFSPINCDRDEIVHAIGCYHEDVTHHVVTVSQRGYIVQQDGKLDEMGTTLEVKCSEYLHRSKSYAVLHNLKSSEIGEATKLLAILVCHLDTPFLNNSLMEYNGVDFPEEITTIQFYSIEMLKAFLVEYKLYEAFEVDPSNSLGYISNIEGLEDTIKSDVDLNAELEVVDDSDDDWGESFDRDPLGEYSDAEVAEMFQPHIEFAKYGDPDDDNSYGGFEPNRHAKRKVR